MIDGLRPYASYQRAEEAWLGRLPSHWETRPVFGAFVPVRERNLGMKEKTVLSLSYGRIVIKPPEKLHGLVPESFETYQIVNPGDIILRTTDLQNDHTSQRVGLVRDRGIITSAYLALKVKAGVHPGYGYRLLSAWDITKAIYGYGSGLRQNLDFSHFKRMRIALPPYGEQAAIVRFLEHADHRIDRFIRAKKDLIALLNEQRQSIIHRAVVGGLDPGAPKKASGIPWLGEIPAHWKTPLLGRCLTRIEQGWSPVAAEGDIEAGQWTVLTLSAVRRGRFVPSAIKPIPPSEPVPAELTVKDGDLLLTRSNTRDRVGDACIVRGVRPRTILSDLIYRLSLRPDGVVPAYVAYLLLSRLGRNQIEIDARGSSGTMPKISQSHIRSWRVLLPPVEEQRGIVEKIEGGSRVLLASIAQAEREIALIQEYRSRLVADIVTGQLEVRVAAVTPFDAESTESPGDGGMIDDD